jgi:hypothetical protein
MMKPNSLSLTSQLVQLMLALPLTVHVARSPVSLVRHTKLHVKVRTKLLPSLLHAQLNLKKLSLPRKSGYGVLLLGGGGPHQ